MWTNAQRVRYCFLRARAVLEVCSAVSCGDVYAFQSLMKTRFATDAHINSDIVGLLPTS